MLKANCFSLLTLACLLATMTASCAAAKPQPAPKLTSYPQPGAVLVHEIVNLAHAPAQQTAHHVQNALNQRGVRIDVDSRANRLILTGTKSDVSAACALIARLDTPTPAAPIQP
jgi:hypothetical protein